MAHTAVIGTSLDFDKICRTCLSEGENLKMYNNAGDIDISLADMLSICAFLQPFDSDGFPNQMCVDCANFLNKAYDFKRKCELNESILRSYVQTKYEQSKCIDENKNTEIFSEMLFQSIDIKMEIEDDTIKTENFQSITPIVEITEPITDGELFKKPYLNDPLDIKTESFPFETESFQSIKPTVKITAPTIKGELIKKSYLNDPLEIETESLPFETDSFQSIKPTVKITAPTIKTELIKKSYLNDPLEIETESFTPILKSYLDETEGILYTRPKIEITAPTIIREPILQLYLDEKTGTKKIQLCNISNNVIDEVTEPSIKGEPEGKKSNLNFFEVTKKNSDPVPKVYSKQTQNYILDNSINMLENVQLDHTYDRIKNGQNISLEILTENFLSFQNWKSCKICNMTFSSSSEFVEHMILTPHYYNVLRKKHNLKKSSECRKCDNKFQTQKQLSEHLKKSVHVSVPEYSCQICSKKGKKDDLFNHYLKKHPEPLLTENINSEIHKSVATSKLYTDAVFKPISSHVSENLRKNRQIENSKMAGSMAGKFENFKQSAYTLKKSHKCKICKKNFETSIALLKHTQFTIHEPLVKEKCKYCPRKYTKSKLLTHMKANHALEAEKTAREEEENRKIEPKLTETKHEQFQNVKTCDICSKVIPKSKFISHVSEKHKEQLEYIFAFENSIYSCTICNKKCSKDFYVLHMKNKHPNEALFKCIICGLQFSYEPTFEKHIYMHRNEYTALKNMAKVAKKFICKHCGKPFDSLEVLKYREHLKQHENSPEIKESEVEEKSIVCDEVFSSTIKLEEHEKNHEATKLVCEICQTIETDLVKFNEHLKGHKLNTENDKEECYICGGKFHSKKSLLRHLPRHRTKRFMCTDCGKRFLTSNALKVHSLLHSGAKPHECNIRKKRSGKLKTHMLTHTKEKIHIIKL